MNRTSIAEIERIKRRIPPKNQQQSAFFSITKTGTGYEVEEIVSADFTHIVEAIMGEPDYLIADNNNEFDTIEAAVSWLNERTEYYHGMKPCLALLGSFTRADVNELNKVNRILLINDKYLCFLFGLEVREEFRTSIID